MNLLFVYILKKFFHMGLSTPFRKALTSGMPEPDAAGEMMNMVKEQRKARRALKAMYSRLLIFQLSLLFSCMAAKQGPAGGTVCVLLSQGRLDAGVPA